MSGNKKLLAIVILVAIMAFGAVLWRRSDFSLFLKKSAFRTAVSVLPTSTSTGSWIEQHFGFNDDNTYLLLFLNNTELRPGGGFLGAYAVAKLVDGSPRVLQFRGTEILDNYAPDAYLAPPAPVQKYLKTNRWQFRDSNWSPDFSVSAAQALKFYQMENGYLKDDIDTVVGFTPTIFEELLKITGPIVVQGQEYNSSNFIEKLEYEVEYGYAKKGIDFRDRKQLIAQVGEALLAQVKVDFIKNWGKYFALALRMLKEKQIVLFDINPKQEQVISGQDWGGQMKSVVGDYLLWVDANMRAWKTDAAIKRQLSYQIFPTSSGFISTAGMTYAHQGRFDWRTTRYRDYARVYAPLGSRLLSVAGAMNNDRDTAPVGVVDQGVENGYQWFGAFISIEPGQTKSLSFQYLLPPRIAEQVKQGRYQLLAQKQIGTVGTALTLSLNFGKEIVSTTSTFTSYNRTTVLNTDKEFMINIEK